jgi:hypothetical protein
VSLKKLPCIKNKKLITKNSFLSTISTNYSRNRKVFG